METNLPSIKDHLDSLTSDVKTRLSKLRLLLLDVDGVLTDGRVIMADDGIESKQFSTRDGFGLFWVRKFGLKTGVISGRSSPATERRCHDLRLDEVHLGQQRKLPVFEYILQRLSLDAAETAYIGDDLIDLAVMKNSGISACPCDAHEELFNHVDIVLPKRGGHGAVRYFVDLYLYAAGHWDSSLKDLLDGNY